MASKKITIQVFSDIHIELWNKLPEIPIKAKYLFLAGDICTLRHPLFYKFFDYCSKRWEKVFYVPGNHEFYDTQKNYNELDFEYKLKLNQRYKNIFYLNDEIAPLNDSINVYGSVFWTNPTFNSTNEAKHFINDYNTIRYFNKNSMRVDNWNLTYVRKLSDNAFLNLNNHLNETNKETIIMTHFPPFRTGSSNPNFDNENPIIKSYFTWPDETLDKLNLLNVPIWISGHTHWSFNFDKFGTKFISNQIGYSEDIKYSGVNEDGIYEIDIIS